MKVVVVDDQRFFPAIPDAIYCRTSREALNLLINQEERIDELILDHDLGNGDDIRDVVRFIEEKCFQGFPPNIGKIYLVTQNPVGYEWITKALAPWYLVQRIRPPV